VRVGHLLVGFVLQQVQVPAGRRPRSLWSNGVCSSGPASSWVASGVSPHLVRVAEVAAHAPTKE